jgi:hypothetical protein
MKPDETFRDPETGGLNPARLLSPRRTVGAASRQNKAIPAPVFNETPERLPAIWIRFAQMHRYT